MCLAIWHNCGSPLFELGCNQNNCLVNIVKYVKYEIKAKAVDFSSYICFLWSVLLIMRDTQIDVYFDSLFFKITYEYYLCILVY